MAVEDSILVAIVGYIRLDMGWEEGSEELKNRRIWTQIILRNANRFS